MAGDAIFLNAKKEAEIITKQFCITKPEQIELEAIAAFYDVYCREDVIEGSDARIQIRGDKAIVTINSAIPEPERKRFGLAHEIGHFILHREKANTYDCTNRDFLTWYKESSNEPQANVFAAELLMPERIFSPLISNCQPSFRIIKSLATLFRTSLTATAFRFVELNKNPCALICVQEAKLSWRCWSDLFHQRILPRGTDIDQCCYAGTYFLDGVRPPEEPQTVPPIVWLDTPDLVQGYRLYEQAVCMPSYRTVLTLLWISR